MTAVPDQIELLEARSDAVAAYCAECRYGVSVASPGVCPMCRGTTWVVPDPLDEVHPS